MGGVEKQRFEKRCVDRRGYMHEEVHLSVETELVTEKGRKKEG